ncbi:MAG: PD-(D/E)XK nuclease family protein, partial [Alistipes sp.]|nr:PD-(D/E)XK nuclease family protein [Alistipes sp.]
MTTFLQEVAADLYDRYGEEISSLHLLFPSRRARVFFIDALSRVAARPLWQPRWTTVDELMTEASGLRAGDRIRLITELYKIYSRFHTESFDKFYFWGELLLTDFDTIDKYR